MQHQSYMKHYLLNLFKAYWHPTHCVTSEQCMFFWFQSLADCCGEIFFYCGRKIIRLQVKSSKIINLQTYCIHLNIWVQWMFFSIILSNFSMLHMCDITVIIFCVTCKFAFKPESRRWFPSQMFKMKLSQNSDVLNGNFTWKTVQLLKARSVLTPLPYRSEISHFHATDHETALSHQPALSVCCCKTCSRLSHLQLGTFFFLLEFTYLHLIYHAFCVVFVL